MRKFCRFATGGQGHDSGVVLVWNMAPVRSTAEETNSGVPKTLCEMSNHLGCVNCVRWSSDGKWLASGGDDAIVMIWQIKYQGVVRSTFGGTSHEQWGCLHMLRGHSGDVLDLSWSPDQKYLASCSVDNTIVVWNAKDLPQKFAVIAGHDGLVKGVTWDPVGKYLATQSDDRSVRVWRTDNWKEVKQISEPFKRCGGTTHVLRLSWSPDGKYIVSAHSLNNDGPTAQIIERGDWKTGMDFVGHRKAVEVVKFNPHLFIKNGGDNYGCIAIGSRDRSVSIWLTNLKRPLVVMHDLFLDSVLDFSWSSDGYELMVCSCDGSVAYFGFSEKELGMRLSQQALDQLFQSTYGLKRASSKSSLNTSAILIEDPEMLKLHEMDSKKVISTSTPMRENQVFNTSLEVESSSAQQRTVTQQKESRTKDGRRRITPITLTTQPSSLTGAPLPFTSFSPKQNKSAVVKPVEQDSAKNTPPKADAPLLESSPLPKPISFEPLSPKKEPALLKETKTAGEKRHLDSAVSVTLLPKAKKPKKTKASETGISQSYSSSKPATPQKVTQLHTLGKLAKPVLPTPDIQPFISFHVHQGNNNQDVMFVELDNAQPRKCSVKCQSQEATLWSLVLPTEGLLLSASKQITCIACKDRSMHILSTQSGRQKIAKFFLPYPPHALKTEGFYVMVVFSNAEVAVWDTERMTCVLQSSTFEHLISVDGELHSCSLTKNGLPVITTTISSYTFHSDMKVWLELSSQNDQSEVQRPELSLTSTIEESTPLAQIQKPTAARNDSVGEMLSRLKTNPSQSSTLVYLESQISRSLCLQSPLEYKHWTKAYVRYLVKENMENRLREFCAQFTSPAGLDRMVLGLTKQSLLKEWLVVVAGNTKLQRLYYELRDTIDTCVSA